SSAASDEITRAGQPVRFTPDLAQAKTLEATGKLGRGKRVVIPAHAMAPGSAIDRELVIVAYDDFPNIALVSVAYKNAGAADVAIDRIQIQEHRFSAKDRKSTRLNSS